jgi:uncharacterized membrane protein
MVRTMSAAVEFCSGITSMSASPAWSTRAMMRMIRCTLLARSVITIVFEPGTEARWPYCAVSGFSTCTSWLAFALRMVITCVTISSVAPVMRSGRSIEGTYREFTSGMILTTLPDSTAAKLLTCRMDRKAW